MNAQQAADVIRRSSVSDLADLLIERLLPSARIVVDGEPGSGVQDLAASQFGGLPSLPSGTHWPRWDKREYLRAEVDRLEKQFRANPRATGLRDIAASMRPELDREPVPLLFLGQLQLTEIHAVAPLPDWPSAGMLLFFYDPSTWGFDPLARGHNRVLYFPAGEDLHATPPPKDLPETARFPHRRVTFAREWTLPTRVDLQERELSVWDNDDYEDLCRELMADPEEPFHRCGGHPQEVQGDMRLECQLVSNGIYCGNAAGYQDPRRAMLEQGAADWQLLLQVDSDEERLGWMWGDAGRVYFWARRGDIRSANFGASWTILQCY